MAGPTIFCKSIADENQNPSELRGFALYQNSLVRMVLYSVMSSQKFLIAPR